jgi:hypothetical protein
MVVLCRQFLQLPLLLIVGCYLLWPLVVWSLMWLVASSESKMTFVSLREDGA